MFRIVRLSVATVFIGVGIVAAPHLSKYVPSSWTHDKLIIAGLVSVVLIALIALLIFPSKRPVVHQKRRGSLAWIPVVETSNLPVPQWSPTDPPLYLFGPSWKGLNSPVNPV